MCLERAFLLKWRRVKFGRGSGVQISQMLLRHSCGELAKIYFLTRENLVKRKIITEPSCPICGLEVETTLHILWECISACDVWGASEWRFQEFSLNAGNFLQLAEMFVNEGEGNIFEIFAYTAKQIWTTRNESIHEGGFLHPNALVLGA
jgi:hypothetical protein